MQLEQFKRELQSVGHCALVVPVLNQEDAAQDASELLHTPLEGLI